MSNLEFSLKQVRQRLKITQKELSRRTGISQGYISALEAGKKQPSLLVALQLASGLGVSLYDLIQKKEVQ